MTDDRIEDLPVSDEQLMALADGELFEADAKTLRKRIEADPTLAQRYALFAETRTLLAEPHTASGDAGDLALDRLAAAIRASDEDPTPIPESAPRFAVVQGGAAENAAEPAIRRQALRFRVAVPAMAAALALAVGGVLGYEAGRRAPGGAPAAGGVALSEGPAARAALASALEKKPSGEQLAWSDDDAGLKGAVSVIATHRLKDGRVCREYETTVEATEDRAIGLGCRGADGRWVTEIVARAPRLDADYAAASGASAVESALEALGSDGAVPSSEEKWLLDEGWSGRSRP